MTNSDCSYKGLVVYVGPFGFPDGGAAARRVLGIASSLRLTGYRVKVASGQLSHSESSAEGSYEGIEFCSIGERTAEHLPKALKYLSYFNMGKKTIDWLSNLDTKPKAVILYSGYSPYLIRLLKWCRENEIPLIFDAVEWYDPPSKWHYLFNPYYWNIELAMRFLVPRCDGVIAISKYLLREIGGNCRRVLVPPTVVESVFSKAETARAEIKENGGVTGALKLVYFGSPGHKDRLDLILLAISEAARKGIKVNLTVIGISELELSEYCKRKGVAKPTNVLALGVLSHSEALARVRNSDYSMLLRNPTRNSDAGFPTKFVESLCVGTPVICNITSDLARYTEFMGDLIVEELSVESVIVVIERLSKLIQRERLGLREKAVAEARGSFAAKNYIKQLTGLIEVS